MRPRSRLVTLVGVAFAVGGLAVVLGVSLPPISLRRAFVTLVGLLALVQGARYLTARGGTDFYATETGDPEQRHHSPTPGDELDRSLAERSGARWITARSESRERLRTAVVGALETRERLTRSEATRLVDEGTWTDDPAAANFLAEEQAPLSLTRRLGLLLRGRSPYVYGFDRALAELDRLQREAQ